ncbi:hypothetical protein [Rhizohabitans arisaemae]|uniref:hypothetical protein n=1 Tax=Rhizohabitans arisaemae TaxID=2720610 RepID=UPI0024B0F636|nr:hypothetical protein [Rhizohabitans arisaemae]
MTSTTRAYFHNLDELTLRFPLVPGGKPRCLDLEARIVQVQTRAKDAAAGGKDALDRGAGALNLAALLLSDGGHPDLARQLCRQQALLFREGRPFTVDVAKLSLQPLINLGRLHAREGDADAAYRTFEGLLNAVRDLGDVRIGATTTHLHNLVVGAGHAELVKWVWRVLLHDGTRALTRAGRWKEALEHLTRHHGIGERLLEGRQVAVLAQATAEAGFEMLARSVPTESWERPMAACLYALLLARAGRASASATATMIKAFLEYRPPRQQVVFYVRLGLTVLGLCTDAAQASPVAKQIIAEAITSRDAYAARELLPQALPVIDGEEPIVVLTALVQGAGLGERIPVGVVESVMDAALMAEAALRDILSIGMW